MLYLNLTSIGDKFDTLKVITDDNLDILGILEGKINESFPTMRFSLSTFHRPYHLNVSGKIGGLIEGLTSTLTLHQVTNIE